MRCPACDHENEHAAEACFSCGKALHALTRGTVLMNRYGILIPLGHGGMGRVYMAHDRVLEEPVAIKVLRGEFAADPDMMRRFLSEVRLARKVSHRNVCRIHEYGEDQGVRFLSMEFVDGLTLKELLEKRALDPEEAYDLAFQVGRGLEAVHGHGIIHRDLKTANIMVDRNGVIRLMDFGIAKQHSASGGATTTGHVVGTPEYMSPEQVQGHRVDFRSDIYSLGCVVYEVFTGRAPFQGESATATMFQHVHERPPLERRGPRGTVPEALMPVIEKALARDADDRYSTVTEFLDAVREARGAPEPSTTSPDLRRHLDALNRDRTSAYSGEVVPPGGEPPTPTHTIFPPTPARGKTAVSRRAAILGSAAAVAVVAVVLASAAMRRGPAESPAPSPVSPAAEPSAAFAATASPLPSVPVPDASASPHGSAVRLDRAPRAGGPELPPRANPSPAPQEVAALSATPSPRRAAPDAGSLRLLIVPPAEVVIDGRSVGEVSRHEMPLPAGRHVVRILHREYEPYQRIINVQPGVAFPLIVDLAEKGIRR
jgi:serine/threonine protein kinase